MSKRSGMSRWEDLKHHFVDVGRYRYILHKFDMETWREKICPVCNQGFTAEPRHYFMSYAMHNTCSYGDAYDIWLNQWYADEYADEQVFPDVQELED